MGGLNGERNFEFLLWKNKRLSTPLRLYSLNVRNVFERHERFVRALEEVAKKPDSWDALVTFQKAEKLLREVKSAATAAGERLGDKSAELTFERYEREKKEKEEKE